MKDLGLICLMVLAILFSPLIWVAVKIIEFFDYRKEKHIVDVFYGNSVEYIEGITYRWNFRPDQQFDNQC